MVYFWSDLPLIYTVWSYFGTKETLNVYQAFSVSFYAKNVVLYAFLR